MQIVKQEGAAGAKFLRFGAGTIRFVLAKTPFLSVSESVSWLKPENFSRPPADLEFKVPRQRSPHLWRRLDLMFHEHKTQSGTSLNLFEDQR